MSWGNRKEIQSLSLLGHWLKSCLFQQWPKVITIQACCSVTNSMWKELVASEAGAHCRQPQQKDQGFGWTLNLNFSSAPGITPCPNHIPGVPVLQTALCMLGLTMDLAHHLAPAWPPMEGTCAATMGSVLQPRWGGTVSCHRGPCPPCSDPPSPHLLPSASWQGLCWANVGKEVLVLVSPHPPIPQEFFYPGCSLTRGQKTILWIASNSQSRISLCMSGDPQDKRDDFIYLRYKKRICAPQIKTVWSL